ncbi:MAG: epoxyqueuosine reductase QueH [Oscillospiraceae bacterium]|nr:epoxyqueuosine reductase QueH [Oscillospiraceae bacterium]
MVIRRNTNFQIELDKLLPTLTGRPTLLLHSCCGPCSSYVLEYLTKYFDVTVLYFNPNIQPEEEYRKRLEYQKRVLKRFGVKLRECDYAGERFDAAAAGLESEREGGARCERCFRLRLEETAQAAKAGGFEWFCTTLTVSPHKNERLLNVIGCELEERFGVRWLPSDFKKRGGFDRSLELSEEMELYRQSYCGCLYSMTKESAE